MRSLSRGGITVSDACMSNCNERARGTIANESTPLSRSRLSLRLKRLRRNKAAKSLQPLQQANHPNNIWGMDLVSGALFDGRRLRPLTTTDLFTRECLGIVVGRSLKGHDVQEALTANVRFRGNLDVLETGNDSEFAGKIMDRWAYERNIKIDDSGRNA